MKSLDLAGIVVSVLFIPVIIYYAQWVNALREEFTLYFNPLLKDLQIKYTLEIGYWTIIVVLCFLTIHILGIVMRNKRNNRPLSFFGIFISTIVLFWDLLMLTSPTSISFDEVYLAWILFSSLSAIIFTFQIYLKIKHKDTDSSFKINSDSGLLDDHFS